MLMALSEPSVESFSKVVEAVYDCALSTANWRKALRLVGEITHSSSALVLTHQDRKRLSHSAECGLDPQSWRFFLETYFENPLIDRLGRCPIGQIFTLASAGNLDEYRKGRFYDPWIRPHRFGDLMGVNGTRSGLAVNRHDNYRSAYAVLRRAASIRGAEPPCGTSVRDIFTYPYPYGYAGASCR
jgi:hypothetical protein